jgi:glucan phosphorylase
MIATMQCPPQGLRSHADDPELQKAWRDVKAKAKAKCAAKIKELTGVEVNTNALFDIQVSQGWPGNVYGWGGRG